MFYILNPCGKPTNQPLKHVTRSAEMETYSEKSRRKKCRTCLGFVRHVEEIPISQPSSERWDNAFQLNKAHTMSWESTSLKYGVHFFPTLLFPSLTWTQGPSCLSNDVKTVDIFWPVDDLLIFFNLYLSKIHLQRSLKYVLLLLNDL